MTTEAQDLKAMKELAADATYPKDIECGTILALLSRIESDAAEIARLEEALKPLAKEADDEGRERDPDSVRVFIKLGDLRRARAALQMEAPDHAR